MLSCPVVSDSVTPWTVDHQVLLFMEFSRQEYWSRLPFPTPRDLPDPGIKPASPVSPALASGYFTTALPGNPIPSGYHFLINIVITNVYKYFCKWITEELSCSFLEITLLKVTCMYSSYEHLYYVFLNTSSNALQNSFHIHFLK